MNTATQKTGAVQPDIKDGEFVDRPNPRNVAIEAMTKRMEDARVDELQDAMENDPGLAATQNAINSQIEEANQEAEREGLLVRPDSDLDGAASREAMHPPEDPPATVEAIPAELAADPLADYIVMENGQPMFQTKVDGQTRLIPLDQAKRELQIGAAAAVRMNEATAIKRSLDERELRVTAGEAALQARMQSAPASASTVPVTPPTGLSDDDLLDEANEIFNTAFSGTEADAAKKLAKSLIKIRDATTLMQPPIDTQAITRQAATMAIGAVDERDRKKDVDKGYGSFKTNYPDIMKDPHLYRMADDMTDEIAKENPEWDISQVMDESGKRTRAWVNNLKGIEDTEDPAPEPTDENANAVTTLPTQETRQERKSGLVRMPRAATGAVHQEPTVEDEAEQSPLEALNELKATRGQPA